MCSAPASCLLLIVSDGWKTLGQVLRGGADLRLFQGYTINSSVYLEFVFLMQPCLALMFETALCD